MRLIKAFILSVPAMAIVLAGVLGFRSCLDENQDYVIIQKRHTKPYFEPQSGREVNPTWSVVIQRDDGMPPMILQCSREAFDSLEVGDKPEVITITNEGGARIKRLLCDAESGWRPLLYAPRAGSPVSRDKELDPRNGD